MDYAIHLTVLLAVVLSLITGRAQFAALLLFANVGVNQLALGIVSVDNIAVYFDTLVIWAAMFAIKDLLFLILFGFRKNTAEFILLLSFAVSCLFHQAILAQVLTYDSSNLTLFAIRPTVMKYVSIVQLATVFYIIVNGSGFNGGKRVKSTFLAGFRVNHNLLHTKAFKVKQ